MIVYNHNNVIILTSDADDVATVFDKAGGDIARDTLIFYKLFYVFFTLALVEFFFSIIYD